MPLPMTSVTARTASALLLPAVLLVALAVGALHTGTEPGLAVHWFLLVAVGVLLPGVCVVRLVRPHPASTADDLGWAGPTGLLFTLLVWFTEHLVGASIPPMAAGAGLAAVTLALPWSRRRVLRRPAPEGAPALLTLVVAVIGVAVVRMLTTTGLDAHRPTPTVERPGYHQDLLFQVALTGELRRTLAPTYPMVAGEPLSYHWFFHAAAAQLSPDGVHDLDVVMRLLPATLMVLLLLLAVSVGAQVAKGSGGGVAAAALVGLAGPAVGSVWSASTPVPGHGGSMHPLLDYWQLSPTQTLAWVFGLATFGVAVAAIRRYPSDRQAPTVLLLPYALGAAGAKSSQNAVLLGGLAVLAAVLLVAWRLRRSGRAPVLLRRTATVTAGVGLVSLGAGALLYPGSYGVVWQPGEQLALRAQGIAPGAVMSIGAGLGVHAVDPRAGAAALALGLLPVLLPLSGAVLLVLRDRLDVAAWVSMGATVAALVAVWTLRHPGQSEWYFLVSVIPVALTVSGAGLAVGLRHVFSGPRERRRREVAVLFASGAAAAAVSLGTVYSLGLESPLQRWRVVFGEPPSAAEVPALAQVTPWLQPMCLVLGAALLIGSLAAWYIGRRRPLGRSPSCALALWLVAVLSAGAPDLVRHLAPEATSVLARPPVDAVAQAAAVERASREARHMAALLDAGRCVRQLSSPDDVVATNRIHRAGPGPNRVRDNREFAVSAVTGLRTELSGYGYSSRSIGSWQGTFLPYTRQPFWDQERLETQLELVEHPTPASLRAAGARGVSWILADERHGPVSPELAGLVEQVFTSDGVHVYRLGTEQDSDASAAAGRVACSSGRPAA